MLKSRPKDVLVKLVETVETAHTVHSARTAHSTCTAHPARTEPLSTGQIFIMLHR